jgi:hypothetical protein
MKLTITDGSRQYLSVVYKLRRNIPLAMVVLVICSLYQAEQSCFYNIIIIIIYKNVFVSLTQKVRTPITPKHVIKNYRPPAKWLF